MHIMELRFPSNANVERLIAALLQDGLVVPGDNGL